MMRLIRTSFCDVTFVGKKQIWTMRRKNFFFFNNNFLIRFDHFDISKYSSTKNISSIERRWFTQFFFLIDELFLFCNFEIMKMKNKINWNFVLVIKRPVKKREVKGDQFMKRRKFEYENEWNLLIHSSTCLLSVIEKCVV